MDLFNLRSERRRRKRSLGRSRLGKITLSCTIRIKLAAVEDARRPPPSIRSGGGATGFQLS